MPKWVLSTAIMFATMVASGAIAQSASDCDAKLARAREDILAYYPPAARAAGIEGAATITCQIDPRNPKRDCVEVSEAPSDQGFGKAALSIAEAAPDSVGMHLIEDQTVHSVTVSLTFTLSPPAISPNLLELGVPKGHPTWVHRPSGDDIAGALARAGVRRDLSGHVSLSCQVNDGGRMSGCKVVEETPSGAGFDRAAMFLAKDFVMSPKTNNGCSVGGTTVNIPLRMMARG